eukprot:gene31422-39518_t
MVDFAATADDDGDSDAATDGHLVMEISIPRSSRLNPPPPSTPATYRVGGWLARIERGLMGRIREIVVRSDVTGAHRSVRCWSVGKYGASVGVARVELDGGGRIGVPIGAIDNRENWVPRDAMPAEMAHRSRETERRARGDVTVMIRDDITGGDRDADFFAEDRAAWLIGAARFCDRRLYICDARNGADRNGRGTAEELFQRAKCALYYQIVE